MHVPTACPCSSPQLRLLLRHAELLHSAVEKRERWWWRGGVEVSKRTAWTALEKGLLFQVFPNLKSNPHDKKESLTYIHYANKLIDIESYSFRESYENNFPFFPFFPGIAKQSVDTVMGCDHGLHLRDVNQDDDVKNHQKTDVLCILVSMKKDPAV
jgi:hypothetical protein